MVRSITDDANNEIVIDGDGMVTLKAESVATALRLFGEIVYDSSIGHIRLGRTRDRDLRIDLEIRQLKPKKKKKVEVET